MSILIRVIWNVNKYVSESPRAVIFQLVVNPTFLKISHVDLSEYDIRYIIEV